MPGKQHVKNKLWSGDVKRVPIPPGRDPFVNTPLLALGPGEDGVERFWISTWNANVGCLAALVTATGKSRIYRFGDKRHGGFYSAVQEDADTLWLCGNLSRVLRFSLSSGDFEEFETGAPEALVFQGMALDRQTGTLFALAHYIPETTVIGFSFDTRRRETVTIHRDIAADKYMRFHFPNGDGSYTFVLHTPGESLLRWNPRDETLAVTRLTEKRDAHSMKGGTTYRLVDDDNGRFYFPGRGWYDPRNRRFTEDGPRPEQDMTWFRRIGQIAWGGDTECGNLDIGRWDMDTGEVRVLCTVPDSTLHGANVTSGGKIVAVNKDGFFYRFDGDTGVLEMSKRLDTDSIGHVDCIRRIDDEHLLGTPFITQRFWEVNVKTGEGYDCGRAAPGGGEILRTWKIGGMVYMAAYTGAELVEYNPAEHPHFPENPRVVAAPPHAMRPVASADDGRHIYYACSQPYGNLGSTLTTYDTETGMASYKVNPLPDQQIVSLCYDPVTKSMLCGTTMHADCRSCTPSSDQCWFARIDPETLDITEKAPAPDGTTVAVVEGPLGDGTFLCTCNNQANWRESAWFALEDGPIRVPERETMQALPEETDLFVYADKPGYFIVRRGSRIEVWDMRKKASVLLLADSFDGYAVKVQDDSVYLLYPLDIEILEGCLAELN
ncbi:MAG: hypothetical protein K9N51_05395 [Candidatus Pacebacteria bacterium]|nr:hypothetical protein [Candidatus Paceibacterota bacterium]